MNRPGRHRSAAMMLLFVAALFVAAGCSSSSHGASSGSGAASDRAPVAGASGGAVAKGRAADAAAKTPLQQRDIVRTATVKLRTRRLDDAADKITALAGPVGGRVDRDDRSTQGRTRTATLVLRVPPDALDRVISEIDDLGTETSRSIHGQDVTASKADITARTAALQTSVNRLRGLLSHSGNINQLVSLESQLTQRESELESMQAQQRALSDRIALATLTVDLSATPKAVPARSKPKAAGLADAFVSGWNALVIAVRGVIKGVGYSLPILAVIAVLAGASVLARRRFRHRNGSEPPATAES